MARRILIAAALATAALAVPAATQIPAAHSIVALCGGGTTTGSGQC
ncbi:MAG TPA: hypothetical protein VGI74_04730 [Streptosporangiaceae bacterium]|jgi:hypothetical protein